MLNKIILSANIALRLFLGVMMLLGSSKKFDVVPSADTMLILEAKDAKKAQELKSNPDKLKRKNYIFGMQQTGYAWQLIGVVEALAGILLISQIFGFLGAVICLPVVLHIFLFHLFLEFDEVGELIETALLLVANIWLIAWEYKNWKHLLINKIWEKREKV